MPETYIRWYCPQMMDIVDLKETIGEELRVVLGDRYDEQRVETLLEKLGESIDQEEFIRQLMLPLLNKDVEMERWVLVLIPEIISPSPFFFFFIFSPPANDEEPLANKDVEMER